MAIYVGFIRADGLENTWAFFNLIFLQNAAAFVFAFHFDFTLAVTAADTFVFVTDSVTDSVYANFFCFCFKS